MNKLSRLLAVLVLNVLTAAAQKPRDLFIGTYTHSGSYGIYIASFDPAAGTLRLKDSIAADQPSFLAVSADGNRLYAVNETGGKTPGRVSSFFYNRETKKWQKLNEVPSGGDDPCYISLDSQEQYLMVANYSGGSLSVLPLDVAGAPGKAVQLIQHRGKSVNADRQQSPHVHCAIFSPDEKYVYAADLGTDRVLAYPFKSGEALPLQADKPVTITTDPGSGPRHLAFHPSLPLVYVMEELSGKVSVYQSGRSKPKKMQSVVADSVSPQPGSADIHISADGRFLYASNRAAAHSVSVFAIQLESGLLTPVGSQSTLGIQPRNFTLDPSGRYLLAANQGSNTIQVFAVDPQNGMPRPTAHSLTVSRPVCLVFAR